MIGQIIFDNKSGKFSIRDVHEISTSLFGLDKNYNFRKLKAFLGLTIATYLSLFVVIRLQKVISNFLRRQRRRS